jgi:polyisoprenyl-phosphate glycosyltransferase
VKSLTVVIPVFNDTDSLVKLKDEIAIVDTKEFKWMIVDNGSTDERLIEFLSNPNNPWETVRCGENLGFGGGILFGISHTKTDFVGWMPGNLKVKPADVIDMVSRIELRADSFIKASRSRRELLPRLKTFIAGLVQSILVKKKMFDSGGTPTLCSREFVLGLVSPPTDYVFESFIYFKAQTGGLNVVRPKVPYGQRMFGQSHWQRGLKSEVNLMKLIWKSSKRWK